MKAFLVGVTIIGLCVPLTPQSALAQDIDPQCSGMRDKVACTCALQNGGQITRTVGTRKRGWRLLRRVTRQSRQPLDREKISFPVKFKWEHWKLRPNRNLEAYLACMHRYGRK
jgi:hypothetical protein